MLTAYKRPDATIETVEKQGNGLLLKAQRGMLRILPYDAGTVRITYTEHQEFSKICKPGVIASPDFTDWSYEETADVIRYQSSQLILEISRQYGSVKYFDSKGKKLLQERQENPRLLEEFEARILSEEEEIQTEEVTTADGVKKKVTGAHYVTDGNYYHTRLHLQFDEEEALYGLGQQEEGYANLRDKYVYCHQANRKIAIPFLVSTKGYGLLMDSYSPLIFCDNEFGSYLYTEADTELDYYFMNGGSPDGAVAAYRRLTGKAAMLPKWAFGYVQSKERYESAQELIATVKEFRERKLPLDCIVLDWMSWPDGMWGQKSFDASRFPDPTGMMEELHKLNAHLMLSIWPNADEKSENYAQFKENGCLLPGSNIYNAFEEKARRLYWQQAESALFSHGLDAWWCDSSEPYTPEWNHKEAPEPFRAFEEFQKEMSQHVSAWKTNAFALHHARGIYEGQRGSGSEKRVCNLTRSASIGQQRYGTILWSGDISATWDVFRRQIAAGLHMCASGLPYWTVDIGAFFVKKGNQHIWDGDYDDTTSDAGYRELYVRWLQWGSFLPMFRSHGTDCAREPWRFAEDGQTPGGNMFYDAIRKAMELRYSLMPYIYSQTGKVWLQDASIMRPLAFGFPQDKRVYEIGDQYLFGDALMVCPVTEPMYYGVHAEPLSIEKRTWQVYLPAGCDWYDYYTNQKYKGGVSITVDASLDRIPLFVKAGSILPVTGPGQYVTAKDEILLKVYPGADCEYILYEDAGDGYGYEKGEYTCTAFYWKECEKQLSWDGNGSWHYKIIE